jgi:hypothetical protein
MRYVWLIPTASVVLIALNGQSQAASPTEATATIDRRIAAAWETAKVTPAPASDDAEFLRRIYLDLTGRIPDATEARHFLDDKSPDKRAKLIEKLLDPKSPHYANHFTEVWRSLLLPEAGTSLQARFQLPSFKAWLRERLASNTAYDAMVRELLTAPLGPSQGSGVGFGDSEPSPAAFYTAKDLMPENLAAAATRVFLGVKLECAQCHDHPFASWKRDQFWSFAAFFSGVKRQGPGDFAVPGEEDKSKHEIRSRAPTKPSRRSSWAAKSLRGRMASVLARRWRTGSRSRTIPILPALRSIGCGPISSEPA